MTAFVGHEAVPRRPVGIPGLRPRRPRRAEAIRPRPLKRTVQRGCARRSARHGHAPRGRFRLRATSPSLRTADGVEFYRWGLYTLLTTLFVQAAVLFLAALSSNRAALPALLTALPVIETIRIALLPVGQP